MSQNLCPQCGAELPREAINLAEGVALCASCGRLSRLADVARRRRPNAEVLKHRPAGCSVSDLGNEAVIHVSLRSLTNFLGSLGISFFWNGIVSVFVLIAISGLYVNLVGPLPAWFPAPEAENPMTLGMTLFLCVFLIPFVTIGAAMIGMMLLAIAGKVEVRLGMERASVGTGIGFLMWRKRFDPKQVRGVELVDQSSQKSDSTQSVIEIQADRKIKFGSMLPEESREWLFVLLRELLLNDDPPRRRDVLSSAAMNEYRT